MDDLREEFLIDPAITYLNHGSFGACPKAVIESYQALQIEMERQPVRFLGREIRPRMQAARKALGEYLGIAGEDLVYFANPTTAINMVARSLELEPGDEILATNHEYGALNRTWRFITHRSGAQYINHPISLPVSDPQDVVEEFWSGVTPRTKVIFISHITSPTALILPIKEICQRANSAGICTIVDGAHAPGQIELDLSTLGADIYSGALHKWLCAPKGAAFLYVSREIQDRFDPLVISWGYESEEPSDSRFIDYHEWQGTRDMAAFLVVPDAIDYQRRNNWPARRTAAHQLALYAQQKLLELAGFKPLSVDPPVGKNSSYPWFAQMIAVQIPECDPIELKSRLYNRYNIEVPIFRWEGIPLLRISVQAYNSQEDIDRLITALSECFAPGTFQ